MPPANDDYRKRLAERKRLLARESQKRQREKAFSTPAPARFGVETDTKQDRVTDFGKPFESSLLTTNQTAKTIDKFVGQMGRRYSINIAKGARDVARDTATGGEYGLKPAPTWLRAFVPDPIQAAALYNLIGNEKVGDVAAPLDFAGASGILRGIGKAATSKVGKGVLGTIGAGLGFGAVNTEESEARTGAAGKTLTTAIQNVDIPALEKLGYRIIIPQNVEDITQYLFGSRQIDPSLPAFAPIRSRLNMPTIFKEGKELIPNNPSDVMEIAARADATIEAGYGRMIDKIQSVTKEKTGSYLTTKQIEDITGMSPSQAVLFGQLGEGGVYRLSDAAMSSARQLGEAFTGTWRGGRFGTRILGKDATEAFDMGELQALTGATFKNIGAQVDHIRSPSDAGTYIADEIIVPAILKAGSSGKAKISSAGQEAAQEINKATQNVEQVVNIPEPTNLGIGGIDPTKWADIPLILRRLGADITGLADDTPTARRYMQQLERVWNVDNPYLKVYSDWYKNPETVAQQVKRLENRIAGRFGS